MNHLELKVNKLWCQEILLRSFGDSKSLRFILSNIQTLDYCEEKVCATRIKVGHTKW